MVSWYRGTLPGHLTATPSLLIYDILIILAIVLAFDTSCTATQLLIPKSILSPNKQRGGGSGEVVIL
jgi:hypothetical protein